MVSVAYSVQEGGGGRMKPRLNCYPAFPIFGCLHVVGLPLAEREGYVEIKTVVSERRPNWVTLVVAGRDD